LKYRVGLDLIADGYQGERAAGGERETPSLSVAKALGRWRRPFGDDY